MSEPIRAPKAVPSPPSVTAAKISSSTCVPMSHLTPGRKYAHSMPAIAASAPARTQTIRMTRSTLMPDAAARPGLSEIARVALPMRVRSEPIGDGQRAGRC